MQHLKDEVVVDAVVRHKGSLPKAAEELGMSKHNLKLKINKEGKILAELRLRQVKGYKPYPLELDERLHAYIYKTNGVLKTIVELLAIDEKKGLDIRGITNVRSLQCYLGRRDKCALSSDLSSARSRIVSNYSQDDWVCVLNRYHGNLSLIASELSVSYNSVWTRVSKDDYLKEICTAAQTKIYSDAQHVLYAKMHDPAVDVKTRVDIAKMVMLNHPQAKKDGWGKALDLTSNGKDIDALSKITVEVVTSPKIDDDSAVIDVDVDEPKQIEA